MFLTKFYIQSIFLGLYGRIIDLSKIGISLATMSSNKLFRAASYLHYGSSTGCICTPSTSVRRFSSNKPSSVKSASGSDMLRLRQELLSTLNQWQQSKSGIRSLMANATIRTENVERVVEKVGDQGPPSFIISTKSSMLPNFTTVDPKAPISSRNRYRPALLKSLNEPYYLSPIEGSSPNVVSDGPYAGVLQDKETVLRNVKTQLEREKRGVVVVPSVHAPPDAKPTIYDDMFAEIQKIWEQRLLQKFQEQIRYVPRNKKYHPNNFGAHLVALTPEEFVEIMFDETCRLADGSDNHGRSFKVSCKNFGRKVLAKIKIKLAEQAGVLDKTMECYESYLEYYFDWPKYIQLNHREFWNENAKELERSEEAKKIGWMQQELGEFLYTIIIESAIVPASLKAAIQVFRKKNYFSNDVKMVNAFYKCLSSYNFRSYMEIRAIPEFTNLKKKLCQREIRFEPAEMPMICPPIPWHRHDQGVLLVRSIDLVRLEPQGATALQGVERVEPKEEDMHAVMDALNVLGSTPWTINKPVLDVVLKIFRGGEGNKDLDIPPAQSKLPPLPKCPQKEISQEEKMKILKARREKHKYNAEMYSLWSTLNYRLSLAEFLRDQVMWFPHNVDFRGRTYPVPPYLNHMGDDLCRGIMQFAKGRPLGKDGLRWLKIHLINLTGLKKRQSIDERAAYADEIMKDILAAADDPLKNDQWWTKSEEPWQTLAVCMEIANAMRSGNEEEYVCHLPVHQDGSCNGMQHYAALGRDETGAVQVNLAPSVLPQDVYGAVAARIEEKRVQDAAADLEIAKILEGFVTRKVIKQTVMTTIYGVTRYGGREQISRQLKDLSNFPKEHVFAGSNYLVHRLFESVGEIFVAASHIQNWFVRSASLISGKLHRTVEWKTPFGFPVAQPYFKRVLSSEGVRNNQKPDSFKQKNAFPPNYIHSLDSTHMMLTALHCQRQGITYAAVHDSYWTHPATVAEMNRVCREQFIGLHSQPLLEELSGFFIRHYLGQELMKKEEKHASKTGKRQRFEELMAIKKHFESLPELGKFKLDNVNQSDYFFS